MIKRKIGLGLVLLLAVFLVFTRQNFSQAQEAKIVLDRPINVERLDNGHTLIADGGGLDWTNQGSEIIEINQKREIVWFFQDELVFVHSVKQLTNGNLLIVDTNNNRLLEVSRDKEIIWTSESWPKGKLADGSKLNYPNNAEELTNDHFLVTDGNNNRIIEIDRLGRIFWQKKKLNQPYNANRIANGHTLISDSENNQVIEVDNTGKVVWSYGGGEEGPLYLPKDVNRLENGNYLITDAGHQRVVEVTPKGKEVWEYKEFLSFPYDVDRLANGNTLISDSSHARVIEINPQGKIVWQFRNTPEQKYKTSFFGSFEEDKDGDGWPDGWIRSNLLAEGSGTFIWDENVFKDGHHSARIDYDGTGKIFWHQYYSVKPGRQYDLIGLIRSQNLDGYSRFELIFVDELGGEIGLAARTPDHRGTTIWTRYETIFTPPQKAVAVDIRCLVKGIGTAWFDEISLKQVGWQRILGVKISLGIIFGGIIIALLLNKFVR